MTPDHAPKPGLGLGGPLIRNFTTTLLVIGCGFILGYSIKLAWWMPAALLATGLVIQIAFRSFPHFLLLTIFVLYEVFEIVDLNWFGHVFGLFRLPDLFVIAIGIMVALSIMLKAWHPVSLKGTRVRLPMLAFFVWLVILFFYTVLVTGEEPMLAVRTGRRYLSYLLPFVLLQWLRTERHWRMLRGFLHLCGLLVILLGVLHLLGIPATFGPTYGLVSRVHRGLFKFYNPGESLIFMLFMWNFWRFCQRPKLSHGFWVGVMALGSALFLFRARIAGTLIGLAVTSILFRRRLRRSLLILPILVVVLVGSMAVAGFLARRSGAMSPSKTPMSVTQYFSDAFQGVTGREETDSIIWRKVRIAERMPLVKKHPLVGVGFVSTWGSVARDFFSYGQSALVFVDAGWISVLLQLGGIGTFLMAAFLLAAAVDGYETARGPDLSLEERCDCMTLVSFVVLMFVSVYSYSYPTLQPAITTFSILLALVIRARDRTLDGEASEEATS